MARTWNDAATARYAFADLIESLTEQQLRQPTLCEGWTPREVLGHVVGFVELGLPRFLGQIVMAKFDFDVAADRMARQLAERPVEDLISALRAKASRPSPLPGFAENLTVLDVTAHAQDIRRGLGLGGGPDDGVVRTLLGFMVSGDAKPIFDARVVTGLTVTATDLDFSSGDGPEVEGRGESLLMALIRRPDAYGELSGMGAGKLVSRLTAE